MRQKSACVREMSFKLLAIKKVRVGEKSSGVNLNHSIGFKI